MRLLRHKNLLMSKLSSNLTLAEKRRDAVKAGLDSLENIWNDIKFLYSKEEVLESREIEESYAFD